MKPMRLVVLGLSLSSSWGNGHATTWRALLRAFAARGHNVLFLERDVAWYRGNRDHFEPFCDFAFYNGVADLERWNAPIESADAVILSSFVPEGARVARALLKRARGAVVFYDIDTPVTLAKLACGEADYIDPEIIGRFDLYLSFTGGPMLRLLEGRYGARAARALYCAVDTERHRPMATPIRWDLSYLGTYSADRQEVLERLLIEPARRAPERRFCVAGALYPDDVAWPANVERREHVAPAEHREFYGASRFTLNLTRAAMRAAGYSPSVRLFEAAACATPIISDDWPGLSDLFRPGAEIVLADDPETILSALAMEESDRLAMARAARARALAEHSAAVRATDLETLLEEAINATCNRRRAPMELAG